ncbi:NUDIX hydrolase [Candidatus Woesearchaeota archaeon]|nr:NUDIX hydrolase [Candidatus Woesearchaeota archaeon]MCF7901397.1 NUDIX hydrolase [Candidatus Woesearchaeota archaeon]MCF8013729.1 NUDIX hydrolase [Candidatus Woesearchaeota archaeon]
MTLYRKCASILIEKNGLLLIVNLPAEKGGGWKFPSGGLELNETIEDTAKREAYEELGLKDLKLKYICKYKVRYLWPVESLDSIEKKYGIRYQGQELTPVVLSIPNNFELKTNEEIAEYKWVEPKELHKYFKFENQLKDLKEILSEIDIFEN